ncbi:phage tail length tape measure family protein [Mesorhizobium sp. CO1-1-9]|uniref:phage tail length tape measure family protein n=1 Tax=Mesorhizobium sp. CO1-1-9 TaxID=2876630 RepID=UPI001CCC1953|nr:phage tail length tape measure family protein [Mesorhizobium sp. CO1-1-9]MBZ9698824.1 phage tail length tape measure family protein [Mesorhizobium sp. CO1-1-9]
MSDKTDDLLISVSTDLSTVKRQLRQLTADIGTTTSGIQKQFDGLGKGIDQSLSPVQKRINAMVGLPVGPKLKEWQGALASVEATSKLTANQMLNLSRQGNDVATMFALGAPPMQIFASQAGQIFDALESGPGGALASVKALGEGAIGLATKFPLVTAAIAAAGVAFIAYEAVGGSHLKTLDEITKTHEANVKLLGDAWDEAAGKKKNYAALAVNSVNALNDKDVQNAKDLLATQIKGIFDQVYQTIGAGGGAQGPLQKLLQSQFEPFKQALSDLANTSDVKSFISQIDQIAEVNPKLSSARDELKGLALEAANTAAAIPGLAEKASALGDSIDAFNRAMAGVDSKPIQKEMQDLFDKAAEGREPIDGVLQSLAALEQANPSFAGILAGFQNILDTAAKTDAALDTLGAKYFANQGTPTNGRQKLPVGLLPDSVDVLPEHVNKEDLGASSDKAQAKAARANRFHAPAKTADDRFFEDIEAIRQRTIALTEEQSVLGLSFEAQTKRKVAFDLETTALKQVREEARKKGDVDWQNAQLTPAQIAQIDAVSEAYARQADALKKAQEMQQLQRDVLQTAFDDLRSSLEQGQLNWQTFGKIAEDVLNKIIDKIEGDLIDSIMQASSAGGSGLLGSALSWLTGGGGGSSQPAIIGGDPWAGMRAAGGPVTKGLPYLVGEYRPEVFVPNESGSILPRVPSIMSGANQNGPAYQDNRKISIDARGAQQGVGEEIKRALAEYDKQSVPRTVAALRQAKTRGLT